MAAGHNSSHGAVNRGAWNAAYALRLSRRGVEESLKPVVGGCKELVLKGHLVWVVGREWNDRRNGCRKRLNVFVPEYDPSMDPCPAITSTRFNVSDPAGPSENAGVSVGATVSMSSE